MKTKENIINCHQRNTYMVKFMWQMSGVYIAQGLGLIELIKTCDTAGIEYIRRFDLVSNKFVRCSRKSILNEFSFETEALEYLKGHCFFN